ncbi:protocadherin-9-like [Entelurus aequoreus]|uniref:protocadherin-9-like n=1 Tax=Entelurus aequoreus TaxID=161455 RepID=UPI002B1DBD5E|nr:protocadherin-9-like [Entelurus aequoreus]
MLSCCSQRRVTFHLPDGSQESCSDSGVGEHEPVGSGPLLTQPLPLVQAQDQLYQQASPDKRTEADGNSDPNSDGPLGPRGLMEASEMCTQECLVLGHSDNCWMPPTLGPYQSPVSSYGSQREWAANDKLLNGHTLTRTWKRENGQSEHFGDRKPFGSGEGHFTGGMADIPLVSLKSCPDSPKDQQL